jgi:hypothetical protein
MRGLVDPLRGQRGARVLGGEREVERKLVAPDGRGESGGSGISGAGVSAGAGAVGVPLVSRGCGVLVGTGARAAPVASVREAGWDRARSW